MKSTSVGKHSSATRRVSQLLEQLGGREVSMRVSALQSLASLDHPSVFDAIVRALSDRNPTVRVTAVEALDALKNKEGVPYLLDRLADSNGEVRMRAAEALSGLLKGSSSPRSLINLLQDTDELVRIAAAEALGNIGDRKALPALRKALRDRSPLVRSYVAEAIGRLGDEKDITRIKKELKGEASEVTKVGFYQALYLLGQHDVLKDLLMLLQSSDYRVRCATANTLSAIPADEADMPLILGALRKALNTESTVAARSSIKSSLQTINQ